jgi:hypothetical protein
MFKSRDKQRVAQPDADSQDRHGRLNWEQSAERSRNKFDPDPVAQFRWVLWLLALLVISCLLLAAWVWFEILHI